MSRAVTRDARKGDSRKPPRAARARRTTGRTVTPPLSVITTSTVSLSQPSRSTVQLMLASDFGGVVLHLAGGGRGRRVVGGALVSARARQRDPGTTRHVVAFSAFGAMGAASPHKRVRRAETDGLATIPHRYRCAGAAKKWGGARHVEPRHARTSSIMTIMPQYARSSLRSFASIASSLSKPSKPPQRSSYSRGAWNGACTSAGA